MRYAPLQAECEKDLAPAGGGGVLGVTFCWVCAAGFLQPLPLKYSVANHRPHLGHVWYTVDNFFLYRTFPFSNPYLLTLRENVRSHSGNSVENATPINPAVNMRLLLAAHFISPLPECAPSSSTEDGKFLHGKRASPLNLWFLKVSRDEDHKRGLLSA